MMNVLRKPYYDLINALEQKDSEEESRETMGRDWCYDVLKRFSNQDFGYDAKAWIEWFEDEDNVEQFYNNMEAALNSRKRKDME